jgi:hypothetical protein
VGNVSPNRRPFGYRDQVREAVLGDARLAALALRGLAVFVILVILASTTAWAGEGPSEGTAAAATPPPAPAPAPAPTSTSPSAAGTPEPGGSPPGGAVPAGSSASTFGGPSLCPRPDAVWAELGTLVPRDRLDARLRAVVGAGGPVVQIFDLGVPYRIVAAGRVREYRDETHDCAYRARIAAVFVALAIDPAELSMEPPPPAPATPIPIPAPRPAARLELAATGQLGIGAGDVSALGGLALRAAVGRDRFALVIGTELLAPSDFTLGGVRLRQWRLPVDVGVRGELDGPRLQPYGEIGLGAALLSERSLSLAESSGGTSLEIGARVGAGVRLATGGRWAPFIAVDGELVPSPPQLFALPRGVLGHTPLLWLGAAIGASLGFL